MRRLIPLLALAALLTGAVPAAASPNLALDYPCYRSGQAITATVTAFDPNTDTTVLLDDNELATKQTDDEGAFSFDFHAPTLPSGVAHDTSRITAKDETGLIAEQLFGVTPLALKVTPRRAPWNARVTINLTGFVERTSLYEHVLRGGRQVQNVLFGTPRAPCGTLKRIVRLMPGRGRPKPGSYTLQFDLRAGYSPSTRPAVRWTFRVPR